MPTNLSEKIKFINRQNELRKEMTEAEREESLVKTVEQVWADEDKRIQEETELSQEEFNAVDPNPETPTHTIAELYNMIRNLQETVAPIPEMLTKINKHINATQKALKKTEKKK